MKFFLSSVDDSEYCFPEWVNALDVMTEWLAKKGQTMTLNDKIQYLNCASEIINKEAQLNNLDSAIFYILEQFGCERSINKKKKNV